MVFLNPWDLNEMSMIAKPSVLRKTLDDFPTWCVLLLSQLLKLMCPMTLSLALRLGYFMLVLTFHKWEFAKYFIPGLLGVFLALSSIHMLWLCKKQTLNQDMKEEAVLAVFTTTLCTASIWYWMTWTRRMTASIPSSFLSTVTSCFLLFNKNHQHNKQTMTAAIWKTCQTIVWILTKLFQIRYNLFFWQNIWCYNIKD